MLANLQVVTQDEFDTWVTARQEEALAAANTPEGRGETLVTQNGCQGCHSIDGSPGTGPTWLGIIGKQEEMIDGTVVTIDEEYIKESILQPQAKIVSGFESIIMPTYEFSDDQLSDIIAYMNTLK
jgi:cytochrome c oxidase subunit 2